MVLDVVVAGTVVVVAGLVVDVVVVPGMVLDVVVVGPVPVMTMLKSSVDVMGTPLSWPDTADRLLATLTVPV